MKVVLYGAGKVGEDTYLFLQSQGIDEIVHSFCDAYKKGSKYSVPILNYEKSRALELPFIITVSRDSKAYEEIISELESEHRVYYRNIMDYEQDVLGYDKIKLNRDWCAYFHQEHMEEYFQVAEQSEALQTFWDENTSVFKQLFNFLDLENVVELACGHGRHVPMYVNDAKHITLVDVLKKNIEFCRDRFCCFPHISYYQNNGRDFHDLPSNTYTSLFTYDAMVHFELMDIYDYLRETYRILGYGGYALFHHSNNTADYRDSFLNCSNRAGRNFMSKDIFSYLAFRAGFDIIEQKTIEWDGVPNLDCVTLVKKCKRIRE